MTEITIRRDEKDIWKCSAEEFVEEFGKFNDEYPAYANPHSFEEILLTFLKGIN